MHLIPQMCLTYLVISHSFVANTRHDDSDLLVKASRVCSESPLALGMEIQSALMHGDLAYATVLAETGSKSSLSSSMLAKIQEDAGRTSQAFSRLNDHQQVLVIDSLALLREGKNLKDMEVLLEMTAQFPDYPGSYRRVLVVATQFERLRVETDNIDRLMSLLALVNSSTSLLREAGFFKLHSDLCDAGVAATKALELHYTSDRDAVARSVTTAMESMAAQPEAKSGQSNKARAPLLELIGSQRIASVVLGDSGDKSHSISGDYVVGAGQSLVLEAGATVRMKQDARIVIQGNAKLIVNGRSTEEGGWVQLLPVSKNSLHMGIRLEKDSDALINGMQIVGASCAISKTGTGKLVMSNSIIRLCGGDGGSTSSTTEAAVRLDHAGAPTFSQCLIEYSRMDAISLYYSMPALENCTVANSGRHAITGNYYAKPRLRLCSFEGNAGLAVRLEDRSSAEASGCVFINSDKQYEIYLEKCIDASTFKECWWGPGAVQSLKGIASGKPGNIARLRDGRDVKDGSVAVSLFPGAALERRPPTVGYIPPPKPK